MTLFAITGWAVRTPLGNTVDGLVDRLLAGDSAVRDNHRFDARSYACRLAADIAGEPAASPHDRILRRVGRFAYHAAREALTMADAACGRRLGLFAGVGGLRAHWDDMMPAFANQSDDLRTDSWKRGFRRIHPYWMLQHLSNNTHALLSRDVDARGEGVTFGGANAGAQALAAAGRALWDGAIDAALVVACDSLIEPETVVEMAARGAAATCDLRALRSAYDRYPTAAVPAEAAAAIVLERASFARTGKGGGERAALAYLCAEDGADGARGFPGADTLEAVVCQLAAAARVIDGAAVGVTAVDTRERDALARCTNADARLTAVQAALGHIGAAASLVQSVALATCLRRGRLPAIVGLREPASGPLQPVLTVTQTQARAALAVTMGAPGLVGAVHVSLDPSR